MIIKYAAVEQNNTAINVAVIDELDNSQYSYMFDFLETKLSISDYSNDKYIVSAFPKDWYDDYIKDNILFIVAKINTEEYYKRQELLKNGQINGNFWLCNELFDSFTDDDKIPDFDELCKLTGV